MMDNESDTSTSLETENFCDNPTRDILAEGFLRLLKPIVDDLEEKVKNTRLQQYDLQRQLQKTLSECYRLSRRDDRNNQDIEAYVTKLINIKHKVTVILNVLQNSQERLNNLHRQIELKEYNLQ
uniref:Biogenesis of lysosome-related organelles complex 1 subunit 7 n=1 Tax=Culicoides sonorensis TaxID=179676 RepID=A0A336LNU9_CULSO